MIPRQKRGYVYSLTVFLIFVSIFVLVSTNIKSLYVLQDSNAGEAATHKISGLAKNIEAIESNYACADLQSELSGVSYADIVVDCTAGSEKATVVSRSGTYSVVVEL